KIANGTGVMGQVQTVEYFTSKIFIKC
ncbi:uncharacterized protein METZ01_LOCUS100264, partial [marine metagenome]